MIQSWFLSPYGMIEAVFAGRRYEIISIGIEARSNLYDYVCGRSL